jgi:hypothetical protein
MKSWEGRHGSLLRCQAEFLGLSPDLEAALTVVNSQELFSAEESVDAQLLRQVGPALVSAAGCAPHEGHNSCRRRAVMKKVVGVVDASKRDRSTPVCEHDHFA